MTLQDLLNKIPHKIQVEFVLECCNDIKHLLTDKRSLRALEITQLWLEDKATKEEVKDAAYAYAYTDVYDAYAATYAATNAAYAAAYVVDVSANANAYAAATAVVRHTAKANAYAAATSAARHTAKALGVPVDHYKTKLINKIKSLPELDLIMLGLKLCLMKSI